MTVLLVALGAAIGAPLRHLAGRAFASRFPWGTLVVNLAGSLLLGFLIGLPAGPRWGALLGTGFCGALTTYSTFGWETMVLAREGDRRRAVLNVAVSIVAGLVAAGLGYLTARSMTG
ncbi:fluoride efflux transporter CrcB [Actinoplanes sp. NPDC051633]|uniref:fluoride efflux transporter CrcB n=1 Tax=Actinoplanes sp. NPDC051633 TaxID=3155670 RepID=UPI00343743CF